MLQSRRAFTLVEMLVVIAIITVLMALLLPVIVRSRESARSVQCQSNLRQLYLGLQQFYDSKGNYPPYRWEDPAIINQYGVVRPRWQWIIGDYLGRPAQNPDAIIAAGNADTTYTNVPLDNEIFFDPSLKDTDPSNANSKSIRNGAYGYNFQYLGNSRNLVDGDITTPMLNYPVRRVKDDARTIAFGDSRGGGLPHGGHSMTLDPPHMRPRRSGVVDSPSPSRAAGFDPYGPDETGTDIQVYFSPAEARHNGRANVVFLDGHCEGLTLADLGYVLDSSGVPQPQPGNSSSTFPANPLNALPWGTNRLWTGVGLDESSPNYTKIN
jgi:prepilin-type processing-associated H-X9-DG protein/prepilin-type N-terminal cleavage/methylation domain-containing protein